MIGGPYGYLAAGVAGLALIAGAYLKGDSNGANRVIARQAKVDRKAVDQMIRTTAVLNAISGKVADAMRDQNTETRTIYETATRIVDRPVYRTGNCLDADGIGLLDRAAANANRPLAGKPAGGPGPAAAPAP